MKNEIELTPKTIIKSMIYQKVTFSVKLSLKDKIKILFSKTQWFDLYKGDAVRLYQGELEV